VATQRLLKSILPPACLWTGLRSIEGFDYEATLREIKALFPPDEDHNVDDTDKYLLPSSVPDCIREMGGDQSAIEALGSMIWFVHRAKILD